MDTEPTAVDPRPAPGGVAAALRETLPGVDLEAAQLIGQGWEARAFRAGDWVIRMPRSAGAGRKITQQTGLYRVLAAAGFPVPRDAQVVHGETGEVVAGVYRYIPGLPARPDRRRAPLARALGDFFTRLHAFATEPVREFCVTIDDLWAGRYEPAWTRCRAHLTDSDRDWVESVVARFLRAGGLAGAPMALIHSDLAEEHVLVGENGRLRGILDFNGPRIADPALDFGTVAERFGWPFTEAMLEAYGGPTDPGFVRRARFYADVRPLIAIAAGLRDGGADQLQEGLARLGQRIRLAEHPE